MENRFSYLWLALFVGALGCSSGPEPKPPVRSLGRYVGRYDATKATFEIFSLSEARKTGFARGRALTYDDTTGITSTPCAIRDTSKSPGDLNECMGLVDPDSCDPDYNTTTRTLTLSSRLVNKSNLADDGSPYVYENPAFVPNTTFHAPFYFKLVGLEWDTYPDALVTTVNTDLRDAECGAHGLSLANDDDDDDERFDCIYPDQAYAISDSPIDPGWNLTPVVGPSLAPGEDTGCSTFMQFGLSANESFTMYFDVLAVKDDGALPSAPTVATPMDGSYVNTASVNVSGSCQSGATVFVEGGDASGPYPASGVCTGGAFSISVPLNQNQANDLIVYQVDAGKQGPGVPRRVTHDDVPPSVVLTSPPEGQQNVTIYADCLLTFSEPMLASTFTTGTNCTNGTFRICRSTTFVAGAITFSADATQAKYAPNSSTLSSNTNHTCTVRASVTDLAGNALGADYTTSFRTYANSGFYEDDVRSTILGVYPADGQRDVSTSMRARVRFSESMRLNTLFDGSGGPVYDGTCSSTVPAVAMVALSSCDGAAQTAAGIPGVGALSAEGTEMTFTPSSPLGVDRCYAFLLSDCVRDLAGERMPLQGTQTIPGYAATQRYTLFHRFRTSADATKPNLVGVFPILDQSGVERRPRPLLVFDEPIDDVSFSNDSVFLNLSGDPVPRAIALTVDLFQQVGFIDPLADPGVSSATYLVSLSNGVSDFDGNTLNPQTTQFALTDTPDATAPNVADVTPQDSTNTDTLCPRIEVVFDEPIDPTSVNESNVQLVRVSDGALKPLHIAIDDHRTRLTLSPHASLIAGDQYRPTISGVRDRSANPMSGTYSATTFTVTADGTTPTVASVYPTTGSTIPRTQTLVVTFSEPMDRSTLMDTRYTGLGCTPIVETSEDRRRVFLNCMDLLTAGSRTLTVNRNVRALTNTQDAGCEAGSGTRMTANYGPASYTVSSLLDTSAPTIPSVAPVDGATSVSTAVQPAIEFDEAIDARTVKATTLFLLDAWARVIPVDYAFSTDYRTVTLLPVTALSADAHYWIVATKGVRDLAGGNAYDGLGGELVEKPGLMQTCFSTGVAACP